MFVAVGLLLLTALYIGMVAALKYLSPFECLDDLCQSEAVDNTIINWASDFFLAFWIFIFALQLSFCAGSKSAVRKSGILTQIFMGGAFVVVGVGHWLYPNSGIDDNHGMLGYWIVWIIFAVFFTISGLGMAHFALSVSENMIPVLKRSFCANNFLVLLCEFVLVLSLSGFLTGSIWCSMEPELQVNEVVENFEPTDEIHACFQIVNYSVMAMTFTYALMWLPVGFLLKAASQQRPVIVLGLPTPIAAILAMVTQWTAGSILLVVLFFTDFFSPEIDYFDAWNTIYGTVLYHWAMLVSLYCLHNLSYGLQLRYDDSEGEENNNDDNDNDEGPPPLSWEWWVTMVAGTVPEPKQITIDDGEKETEKKEFDEENNNKKSNPNSASRKSVTFYIEKEIAM